MTSPVFCCKLDGKFPDITVPSNLDCASAPNATTSNYMSGCYEAVEDYVMGYRIAMIVGVALLITCQFLDITTACILYQDSKKEENAKKKAKKDEKLDAKEKSKIWTIKPRNKVNP
ncbi:hypothetical protein EGW08_014813 [Elysia chlorotica]|uniref:Tetraspanin n=1 Tax=Elysia chlorotica TaxID=188477 RepID=A0A433T743_ELYCH|nr:hypothetical protein EGW08_014813 [Elysia chlorotica]